MTASIAQFTEINAVIGATNTAITTTLVANDLLMVFYSTGQGGGRTVTCTGLGTWTTFAGSANLQPDLAKPKMQLFTLTGVTGTGNVTLTVVGEGARAVLFVVRGLVNPKVLDYAIGATDGVLNTAYAVGAPMRLAPDQAVLSLACTAAGGVASTWTFPDTGSSPSAGAWTQDNAASSAPASGWITLAAHALGGDGVTAYQTTVKRLTGQASGWGSLSLVLGEPAPGSLVLTQSSTEALVRGTPNLALEQTYAEAIVRAPSDAVLETVYVEALAKVDNVVYLQQSYLEVLTGAAVAAPTFKRGWGILV